MAHALVVERSGDRNRMWRPPDVFASNEIVRLVREGGGGTRHRVRPRQAGMA